MIKLSEDKKELLSKAEEVLGVEFLRNLLVNYFNKKFFCELEPLELDIYFNCLKKFLENK